MHRERGIAEKDIADGVVAHSSTEDASAPLKIVLVVWGLCIIMYIAI
jgi:hypothetical protein